MFTLLLLCFLCEHERKLCITSEIIKISHRKALPPSPSRGCGRWNCIGKIYKLSLLLGRFPSEFIKTCEWRIQTIVQHFSFFHMQISRAYFTWLFSLLCWSWSAYGTNCTPSIPCKYASMLCEISRILFCLCRNLAK